MKLERLLLTLGLAAVVLVVAPVAYAGSEPTNAGRGKAIVTVLPAKGSEVSAVVPLEDLRLKVGGREATVTGWKQLTGTEHRLEVVVLIDDGANSTLSSQLEYLVKFLKDLPEGARATVAYMRNGQALLSGPLTSDHGAAARGLRVPTGGSAGISASPYFCLSDLAKKWPSQDHEARREVVMITNGIDYYSPEFDPRDPYVVASIADSLRNNLVVYSIYWRSRGGFDQSSSVANNGQSLLGMVATSTGGESYWMGSGDPPSIQPYLSEIALRIENQYALRYTADAKIREGVESVKLGVERTVNKLTVPKESWVAR